MTYEGPDRRQLDRRMSSTTEMWLERKRLVIHAVVAACVSLLVAGVTTLVVSAEVNEKLRVSNVTSCDGSNLLRGYALLATADGKPKNPEPGSLGDLLLKIRDCEATFERDRIVPVENHVEREFLAALASGRRVAVRDSGRRLELLP
jgi:hypothetical protein